MPLMTSTFDDCDTSSNFTSFTVISEPSSTLNEVFASASNNCEADPTTATFQIYTSPEKASSSSTSIFTPTSEDCDILPTPITITTSNSEYETSSATSALPTLWYLIESDSNSCKYSFGNLQGSSEVCVQNGDLTKWERWLDSLPGTFDEYVSTCMGDYEYASFYYANNLCQTFPKTLHDLGFENGKSEGSWYDKHCIECYGNCPLIQLRTRYE